MAGCLVLILALLHRTEVARSRLIALNVQRESGTSLRLEAVALGKSLDSKVPIGDFRGQRGDQLLRRGEDSVLVGVRGTALMFVVADGVGMRWSHLLPDFFQVHPRTGLQAVVHLYM